MIRHCNGRRSRSLRCAVFETSRILATCQPARHIHQRATRAKASNEEARLHNESLESEKKEASDDRISHTENGSQYAPKIPPVHVDDTREVVPDSTIGTDFNAFRRIESDIGESAGVLHSTHGSVGRTELGAAPEVLVIQTRHPSRSGWRSSQLPISPLMNPDFHEARQKHHQPKAMPKKRAELSEFQSRIARNPFARALATPLRKCKVTQVTLPKFFLQDWNAVEDPQTKVPWFVPRSLTNKYHAKAQSEEEQGRRKDEAEEDMMELDVDGISYPNPNEHNALGSQQSYLDTEDLTVTGAKSASSSDEQSNPETTNSAGITIQNHSALPKSTPSIGPTTHALSTYLLIEAMSSGSLSRNRKSKKNRKSQQQKEQDFSSDVGGIRPLDELWLSQRNMRIKGFAESAAKIRWRPDMADFILELMRRRIVEGLLHLSDRRNRYLTTRRGNSGGRAKLPTQVGAVLHFGRDGSRQAGEGQEADTMVEEYHSGLKVPMYDMRVMLGQEKIEWLRRKLPEAYFGQEVVFVKHKNMTVDLQMRLWKLRGYLAEAMLETRG